MSDEISDVESNAEPEPSSPALPQGESDAPVDLPFDPERTTTAALVRYGRSYVNDEPRLALVMQELRTRDTSPLRNEVQALQLRWEHLVRYHQPPVWPSSSAMEPSQARALSGRCYDVGSSGMLGFFGYHVGVTQGLREALRQRILDYVYRGELPLVNGVEYTRRWGSPESGQRLKFLAVCIRDLAQRAVWRRNESFEEAINEWEQDLEYLKRTYFRPDDRADHDWEWPNLRFWLTDYIRRRRQH